MKNFDEKLYALVKNIKFEDVQNNFQTKLHIDIRMIQNKPHAYCPADITFVSMEQEDSQALIEE